MNALSLVQRVSRRNPAYQFSEYLDEVNVGYKECWDYILQLDDSYFTDTQVVTTTNTAAEFDFIANSNGNLNAAVSYRAFQIDRIRILLPSNANWASAQPRNWNDSDYLAQQQISPQSTANSGPYLYVVFSKFSVVFGRPLPPGTQIEVIYSLIWLPLAIVSDGTVTTSVTSVTGTGTFFTRLLFPDYVTSLPGGDEDISIGAEFVFPSGQIFLTYKVARIIDDTHATLLTPTVPPFAPGETYQLCGVPDIPEGHHNVISTLATRNFMSTPGNDARANFWAAMAEKELDAMRDTIMVRQRQAPARVRPFQQRILRDWANPGR